MDSSGAWLSAWAAQCGRGEVGALRTPVTMHPHPAPAELGYYAEAEGRQAELVRCAGAAAPLPSAALLLDFCRARVVAQLPEGLQAPLQGTVTGIEPVPGAGEGRHAWVSFPQNCRSRE